MAAFAPSRFTKTRAVTVRGNGQPLPIMTAFEIKSTQIPLMALHLKSANLADFSAAFEKKYANAPGFFNDEGVLLDLTALTHPTPALDLSSLCQFLRQHRLKPVALRSPHTAHLEQAARCGLFITEVPAPAQSQTTARAAPPIELTQVVPSTSALIVDKPLRSGQQIYAKGRDLIVMAMVNPGAEVVADGHIHVYAPLRGKAIAGAKGDVQARIFSTCLEAELVAIAGVYRTSDVALPKAVLGKPAQVRLQGESLVMMPM